MQGVRNLNETPLRLTPQMASLRLLVLRFVRQYLTDWGASPSYGEIAAGLNTNRTRVRKAVRSLAHDGLLLRSAGPRGLALPDEVQGAVKLLNAHGYRVEPVHAGAVTQLPLQAEGVLDYDPARTTGGASGGEEEGGFGSQGDFGAERAAQCLGAAASGTRG